MADNESVEVNLAQDQPRRSSFLQGTSLMVGDTHSSRSIRLIRSHDEDENDPEMINRRDSLDRKKSFSKTDSYTKADYSRAKSSRRTVARSERAEKDKNLLRDAVVDAGIHAFGAVFVEVWVMNDEGTKLKRPAGGHWMDPAFGRSLPDDELIEQALELDRVASDCPPGAGLAGTLFEETSAGARSVHWRQIKSLMDDPFVQRGAGERMKRLYNIGIGLVATVPFTFQDQHGIVLFYSRYTANVERLRSPTNEKYMIGATDLIGASFAIHKPREQAAELRRQMFREAIEKVRLEIKKKKDITTMQSMVLNPEEMKRFKMEMQDEGDIDEMWGPPRVDKFAVKMARKLGKFGKWVFKRVNNSRRKWSGAGLHGPPRQTLSDCSFAFVGVFFSMLALLRLSYFVNHIGGTTFDFDGSWYSSSLCILYALTPAPVGQPRQIYAAHLWNMLVGMALKQIPSGENYMHFGQTGATYGLPILWKQALAVALGVSGQAYIGILHPPATGLSLNFATHDKWSWGTMASVMFGDTVMIVISMLYLNLSEKKQYPLYWLGLGWKNKMRLGIMQKKASTTATTTAKTVARRASLSSAKSNGDEKV